MTKTEFIKRCCTIYDMHLMDNKAIAGSLRNAADCFLRIRHVYHKHPEYFDQIKHDHQGGIAIYDKEINK